MKKVTELTADDIEFLNALIKAKGDCVSVYFDDFTCNTCPVATGDGVSCYIFQIFNRANSLLKEHNNHINSILLEDEWTEKK